MGGSSRSGRVYAPMAYAGAMEPGSRIDALLEAAGLEARATGPPGSSSAGGTTARIVRLSDGAGRPVAVAKLADPSVDDRRIDAEAHVLGVLGPRHELPVPRLLARRGRDLLVAWAGDTGDDAAGGDRSGPVLAALQRVHRVQPAEPEMGPLTTWGRGTADRLAAFDRRTRRLERRLGGFLSLLPPETADRWRPRLDQVRRRHPEACRTVASLGGDRLIHGDLHRGNLRCEASRVWLIDWQQASIGHPLVDVVRWLVEHGPADAASGREHARAHAEAVAMPADEVALAAVLETTLAGLVSGFGARRPETLRDWEQAVIHRVLDERGWPAAHLGR